MLIGSKCDDKSNRAISMKEGQKVIILNTTKISNIYITNYFQIIYSLANEVMKTISSTMLIHFYSFKCF